MAQQSLVDALRKFSMGAISQASARLALLGLELSEERERVITLIISALTACFFVFLAVVFSALLIVVYYWDTPKRMTAVFALATGSLIIAMFAIVFFVYRIRKPISIFSHSLSELEKDGNILETIK